VKLISSNTQNTLSLVGYRVFKGNASSYSDAMNKVQDMITFAFVSDCGCEVKKAYQTRKA